jgi:hypothetical protein
MCQPWGERVLSGALRCLVRGVVKQAALAAPQTTIWQGQQCGHSRVTSWKGSCTQCSCCTWLCIVALPPRIRWQFQGAAVGHRAQPNAANGTAGPAAAASALAASVCRGQAALLLTCCSAPLVQSFVAQRLEAGYDPAYLRQLFDFLTHVVASLEAPARSEATRQARFIPFPDSPVYGH